MPVPIIQKWDKKNIQFEPRRGVEIKQFTLRISVFAHGQCAFFYQNNLPVLATNFMD
jgi:hypothetical protein